MAILNLGSINWDRVFRMDRFPIAGETLTAKSVSVGLGGKGLNQSVAIARSGGDVRHLGAVGAEDSSIIAALADAGIGDDLVARVKGEETGSATIFVDDAGENIIVLDPGANEKIPDDAIDAAFGEMTESDWLLFQNETNQAERSVDLALAKGMRVAYAAAPFVEERVLPLLGKVDLLAVNAVEMAQLEKVLGGREYLPEGLGLLVTRGRDGAELTMDGQSFSANAFEVDVVDSTGAGDVFLGVLLGEIDRKQPKPEALRVASVAAALQVGRPGASTAIPTRAEIDRFLERQTS